MALFSKDGHVLMFSELAIAQFFDERALDLVVKSLNHPFTPDVFQLRDALWDMMEKDRLAELEAKRAQMPLWLDTSGE